MVARPRSLWTPRWWIIGPLVWLVIGGLAFAEVMTWRLAGFISTTWCLLWVAVLSRARRVD